MQIGTSECILRNPGPPSSCEKPKSLTKISRQNVQKCKQKHRRKPPPPPESRHVHCRSKLLLSKTRSPRKIVLKVAISQSLTKQQANHPSKAHCAMTHSHYGKTIPSRVKPHQQHLDRPGTIACVSPRTDGSAFSSATTDRNLTRKIASRTGNQLLEFPVSLGL